VFLRLSDRLAPTRARRKMETEEGDGNARSSIFIPPIIASGSLSIIATQSLGPWLLHLRSRNASKTWQTTPSQRLKRRDHKPHRRRTTFCSLRGRGEAHAHACANLNTCMTARVTSGPPCSSANATLAGGEAGVRGRQRRKFDTARTQTNCRETMKGRRQEPQHMSNVLALPSTMHLHDSSPRS
jgi:hypothetical protein